MVWNCLVLKDCIVDVNVFIQFLFFSVCGMFSSCRATRTTESDLRQVQGTGQSASSGLQKYI
jgi:hypothetical protein